MSLFNFLKRKPKNNELAISLTYIITRFTVENFGKKSEEEKQEILYFLVYQVDRMLFSLNPKKRNEIFDAFSKNLFSSLLEENASSEDKKDTLNILFESYDTRAGIYSNCTSLMGKQGGFPGKGTEICSLGYILKKASGQTEILFEDIIGVLSGNHDIDNKNTQAFLDFKESLTLTIHITPFIIEIKKFLNKYKI